MARPSEWESLSGTPILRLRNELLPLVFLSDVLDLPGGTNARVVVVREGDLRYGIVVDDSPGTEEIVIKPLDPLLANTTVYSGATILPNGTVALVLDIAGLATPAGIQAGSSDKTAASPSEGPESNIPVVYLRAGSRVAAIDLADVERLEEFPGRSVQTAAGRSVIRYRSGLLTLQTLDGTPVAVADNMQAVVVKDASTDLGLRGIVVDEIVDIGDAPVIASGNGRDVRAEILLNESVADLLATTEILKGSP